MKIHRWQTPKKDQPLDIRNIKPRAWATKSFLPAQWRRGWSCPARPHSWFDSGRGRSWVASVSRFQSPVSVLVVISRPRGYCTCSSFKPDDAVLVRRLVGPEDDASIEITSGNVQRVGRSIVLLRLVGQPLQCGIPTPGCLACHILHQQRTKSPG